MPTLQKMPTGISALDAKINGGALEGDLILLLGMTGAGHYEFCLTSAAKLTLAKENPERIEYFIGTLPKNVKFPNEIHYITFAKSKNNVLSEVRASFNKDFSNAIITKVQFRDFSRMYFHNTIIPPQWTEEDNRKSTFLDSGYNNVKLLESLIEYLEQNAKNNLVIMDSITDLLVSNNVSSTDLIAFLRGLQRISKKWKGLIYLLLTTDIVQPNLQNAIIDSVDNVFFFEWSKSRRTTKLSRYMTILKSMPILLHLREEEIEKFAIDITSNTGLVVSDYIRV